MPAHSRRRPTIRPTIRPTVSPSTGDGCALLTSSRRLCRLRTSAGFLRLKLPVAAPHRAAAAHGGKGEIDLPHVTFIAVVQLDSNARPGRKARMFSWLHY